MFGYGGLPWAYTDGEKRWRNDDESRVRNVRNRITKMRDGDDSSDEDEPLFVNPNQPREPLENVQQLLDDRRTQNIVALEASLQAYLDPTAYQRLAIAWEPVETELFKLALLATKFAQRLSPADGTVPNLQPYGHGLAVAWESMPPDLCALLELKVRFNRFGD